MRMDKDKENIYYSDGFVPEFYFSSYIKDIPIEPDKVIIPKTDLKTGKIIRTHKHI